eukprot:c29067_g5_i1 orf=136-1425(+)
MPEDQEIPTGKPIQKRRREDDATTGSDKKWPGWPGDNVYRLIVPVQKIGNIIGRKGEYVKKMCEETRSRIRVLNGVPGVNEQIVMVSGRDDPEAVLSPAMDGILKVHLRTIEGTEGEGDGIHTLQATSGVVASRLLVPDTQAGNLIGRQGATIKTIQETSGATVRVMPAENLPICVLQDDRVVEIQGEPAMVHKAVELVVSHLRKFLVDRSVLQLFEHPVQSQNEETVSHAPWGHGSANSLLNATAPGLGVPSHYNPPAIHQHDSYYQTSDILDSKTHHHGVSMYGRDPGLGGLSSSAVAPLPAPVITQVTQKMQIPLSYADAIIGTAGANISYMRRISGAVITIRESIGTPGEMTIEICGRASQVQAAQQLIQSFMAEASTAPSSAYKLGDSAYGSYSPQRPVYGSMSGPTGYSTGAYGASYNSSYAY